jgi:hypothetical protein
MKSSAPPVGAFLYLGGNVKVAYADPPYIGQAKKHYSKEDSYAGEVDHRELLRILRDDFPDGWALSCSSPSLQQILGYCTELDIHPRIAAWVKPFHIFKPNVNPSYGWEPIVWMGGRQKRSRSEATVKDFVSANITLKKGLVGAKPPAFCEWLFSLLGLQADDELVDLFPGTGIVTNLREQWKYSG